MENLRIFAGQYVKDLAQEVCERLGEVELEGHLLQQFPNNNFRVKLPKSVAGKDVFIIQSLFPQPHEMLMELRQLAWMAKRRRAKCVTAVLTFDSYLRSDREDEPRVCPVASLNAKLNIAAGIDRVTIVAPHFNQISGYYDPIPCYLVKTVDLLAEKIEKLGLDAKKTCVVAPDKNRTDDAQYLGKILGGLPVVILFKRRISPKKTQIVGMVGKPRKICVVIDDEILYGGTSKAAIAYLLKGGAERFVVACTHGLFQKPAIRFFSEQACVDSVFSINTVSISQKTKDNFPKLTVISIAKRIARIIRGLHFDEEIDKHLIIEIETEKK
jgi:ribose-phosphate pyrophosphokinase